MDRSKSLRSHKVILYACFSGETCSNDGHEHLTPGRYSSQPNGVTPRSVEGKNSLLRYPWVPVDTWGFDSLQTIACMRLRDEHTSIFCITQTCSFIIFTKWNYRLPECSGPFSPVLDFRSNCATREGSITQLSASGAHLPFSVLPGHARRSLSSGIA